MTIITESGLSALHKLIRAENPTLPISVSDSSIRISDVITTGPGKVDAVASGRYGHGYRGRVDIKYKQLDISVLLGGRPLVIYVETPRSMHGQLADIAYYTGITFHPNDIVDTPSGSGLPYASKITASPSSASYIGSIDVKFEHRDKRLDELVPWGDHDVALAPYVPANTDRARGEYLTYGTDYTAAVTAISKVTLGVLDGTAAQSLAAALKSVDLLPWTSADQGGFWSLLGAKVIYNGTTGGYRAADLLRWPKLTSSHVLIVDMIVDHGAGDLFGSQLFIHYNVLE